ncbi:DUF1294 domain-containing protein [Melghirimyces profundicolus]|uniref:DUF1294 domain-containing protein n=1 Tax=Melghirimyces profundicolus TaxID=1242148 RepID=UPI000D33FBB1|nr:DUF1294 domain-containing protein [Melghirimyces profundicolus]
MTSLWIYLLWINGISFVLMGLDKSRARRGEWRIAERTLLFCGFLGGAAGLFGGMRRFRHKTMHPAFRYGVPALFLFNLLTVAAVYRYLAG